MNTERRDDVMSRILRVFSPRGGQKKKRGGQTWRLSSFRALTPALVAAAVAIAAILMCVQPKRYDLKVDDVAPETIKATREIEDTVSTQKLIDAAVASVDVRYTEDEQALADVLSGMDDFTEACRAVRETAGEERERWRQQELNKMVAAAMEADPTAEVSADDFTVDMSGFTYSDAFLGNLAAMLPGAATGQQVAALLNMSSDEVEVYCRVLRSCVETTMNTGVKESLIASACDIIMEDFAESLPNVGEDLTALAREAVQANVKANLLLDTEALEAARQKAIESVTPVTYKKGELIVEEGKRVTEAQYEVLRSLSLLRNDSIDFKLYFSAAAFVLAAIALFCIYLYEFHHELAKKPEKMWMLCWQLCILMVVGYFCRLGDIRLVPVTACALVITAALRERVALAFNVLASFLVGMMAGESGQIVSAETLEVAFASIAGGCAGVFFLRAQRSQMQRGTLLFAGAISGAVSAAVYMLFVLAESSGGYASALGFGLGSGVLSGMLSLGILPFWENLFDVLTPMKMMELSNPNQPLLRRLLMEASGTYHHSIVVANLAEQAADAIGADGLFARTAAYYHDVGKLKRPVFFKENQVGSENPHDHIAPELSAMILISHTTDGVAIAKKYRLPQQIQDVIRCHHGDTMTAYFYGKACKIAQTQQNGSVHEADFRYPGPRPRTREEAVIMLADTIEAASRTLREHTPDSIRELVEKLVRGKLSDGQLDETPLTLRDLGVLIESFIKTLSSTYHERIEYPELPKAAHAPEHAANVPAVQNSGVLGKIMEEEN